MTSNSCVFTDPVGLFLSSFLEGFWERGEKFGLAPQAVTLQRRLVYEHHIQEVKQVALLDSSVLGMDDYYGTV